jgi:two-component system CheB/CheR fusion protein
MLIPIIAIGASAGGVEALRRFFSKTQPGSGSAFVVYLHFPPHSTSHLVEILGQCTQLPVSVALTGQSIQPDHVYVVPPGMLATFSGGEITLGSQNHVRNPIDTLFCSLANEARERAIGVVLSGTGNDGARGIEAISAKGGLTVAQKKDDSGGYPEMPASAVATGMVDYVLAVEEMPAQLLAYCQGLQPPGKAHPAGFAPHRLKSVKDELCELLRKGVRHDFSRYKASTFLRRVGRRMRVLKITDWGAYVNHVRDNQDEVLRLFRDLLIGVTAFFRDEAAFQALTAEVIPRLFEGKGPQDKVRVWVAGCSSGEEAYSIAILLSEHALTLPLPPQLQIFATDVDEDALQAARVGRYRAQALEGMREDRIGRFFVREGNSFMVSKELRSVCTFAVHSIIRDPPLCTIDLISCRNVLIYFDRYLQDQVIPTFHFALRPGGILFLGPSESIGRHSELFTAVDNANRLFERVGSAQRSIPFLPLSKSTPATTSVMPWKGKKVVEQTIAHAAETRILQRYGPANVVVNEQGDVVHFSARTGKYLEPVPGAPNQNFLAMVRKGMRACLRGALLEAKKTGGMAVRDNIALELDAGVEQKVRVTVEPLNHESESGLWLVIFVDTGSATVATEVKHEDAGIAAAEMAIQQLERELHETRESLQSSIDEYEIAVEELRSSNEELTSMNDDLQASNEELEASKEEIHVVNDELRLTNAEVAAKVDQLMLANSDLRNLFESTKIAVIFLDSNLVIRSYTPAVTEMFRLVPNDYGHLIADIPSFLDCDTLSADITTVIDTHEAVERAVARRDGSAHYLLRVIPYRTLKGEMDGVVITLVNVTAAIEAQAQDRYHRLLIGELNHRVKNILTVASSLAAQSLRSTTTPDDFAKVFLGRLQALSKAHELLSDENWSDVSVEALIAAGLELQTQGKGRVTLHGPATRLSAKAATTLSLAIHELTTNAIKYGAFANDTGHIDVGWEQESRPDGTFLAIHWQESGGLPVHPPAHRGFGSEMIERGIKYELRGQAKMDFLPAGLEVRISIPLDGQGLPALQSASKKDCVG